MEFYANCIERKKELRTTAKQMRRQLSTARREEAAQKVLEFLPKRLINASLVLSFASFEDEINLWPLNQFLLKQNALCLPDSTAKIFRIQDMSKQLRTSTLGFLESDSKLSDEVLLETIDAILVPGLLFDEKGFRIGYGRGFYDRLLVRASPKTHIFGVGFLEQFSNVPLPIEKHDIAVQELILL